MRILLSVVIYAFFGLSSLAARDFDDRALSNLLREHREGLIYVWTPGMPLSQLGLEEAQKIAIEKNIAFKAVTDPDAMKFYKKNDSNKSYPDLYTKSMNSPVTSFTLQKLGVLNHFPATVFFRDGKIISPIIHGYETPEGYKNDIERFLFLGEKQ